MKTYRTKAQWQQLLQQRCNFNGTNIEFCQYQAPTSSRFIQTMTEVCV
ncbi:hypothetical protein [Pseudoalteromonas tunicata]|nr:hypothetical protein [Pseudoalteromonas tunicata]ATC93267.1 hypothetical protein PTUN_a0481 [Pseudoalteromonas tunicata]